MTLQQQLLSNDNNKVMGIMCSHRKQEHFIGDLKSDEPNFISMRDNYRGTDEEDLVFRGTEAANLVHLHEQVAHERADLQKRMVEMKVISIAGLVAGLVALVVCTTWLLTAPSRDFSVNVVGHTELAFDYFEETLKTWDLAKTAQIFADEAQIRFYNQGTKETKTFDGRSGAVELLKYAAGLGCAKLRDTVAVREIDEVAKMVYVTWDYPKSVTNFCGPSAETYIFDNNYRILRLNALVNWRTPKLNATEEAFDLFEIRQEAWDLEGTALTFAEDAVTRFHNLGTGKEKVFNGRAGAKELLVYAAGLGCAKHTDTITAREVDESARMVYISWIYPASSNVSNFCRPSTEVYTFDRDYKISRLNCIVDWRAPLANPTRDAFDHFHTVLKTWNMEQTVETFAHDVVITFYNQGTKELKTFQGHTGAVELLQYATSLPCAKMADNITVKKYDEFARTVYTAWEYPRQTNGSNRCGASAEMYMFSEDYKIFRLNALVDWS